MIKTAEELRVKLEGKTERTEIEAVLNGATVGTLKSYVKEEGFDCTGYHTWKKADFVETIAVALMEDIAKENCNSEEEALIVSTQPAPPAEKSKLYITFVKGRKYRGKLNGIEQILTVTFSDSEHDLVSFETEDGRSYVCAVNYETQAAWGTSEVVVMRVPGMTLRVNARDKVHGTEEAPIENAQVLEDTQTGFDKGANREIVKMLLEALSKKRHVTESQPEALYEDESYSDFPGDNSCPDDDIPEAHTPDEFTAWTDEDFYFYFPDGEMTEPELVELTLDELDALNEYLARKDAEKWKELDGIRARQKYPLVWVKKGYVPPEDMMLYPIGMYDSYEEMKIALDKNFEMVDRCKDGTDMQYLFYTCNLHTAYMMVKARGYETRFEEWQSIKDNVVHDFIRQELAWRENFLKRETISKKKKEITAMLNKYAEINGTVRAIHDGIKIFRKGIEIREKQGLPIDAFEKAIKEVREKYREWRIEGFKLRLKLLRVMSAAEIRLACEAYTARCEEIRRGHLARK